MKPPLPGNERKRLEVLWEYEVLDTPPEETFDELVALAATICEAPIALISLVDEKRQWFKSKVGITAAETSRDISFCAHAILQPDVMVVPDAMADTRFSDSPLVTAEPHIRFYAGAPLITPDGHALGTLCVLDRKPHEITPEQRQALRILSRHVMMQLELRRRSAELARADAGRRQAEADLQQAHDQLELRVQERTAELAEVNAALRQSEERFSKAFRASPVGICLSTLAEGRFIDVNDTFLSMFGFRRGEVIGRTAEELKIWIDPVDRPGLARWLNEQGSLNNFEKKFRRKSGEPGCALCSVDQVELDGEKCIVSLLNDVTERKQAEEQVRQEKNISDSLIQSLPGVFYLFDAQRRLLRWNDNLETVSGYNAGELITLGPEKFCDPQEWPRVEAAFIKALTEGQAEVEAELVSKDGRRTPYYYTGVRVMIQGAPCLIGMGLDLTARKQAEAQLKHTLSLFNAALESTADGLLIVDTAGKISRFNQTFARMWRIPEAILQKQDDQQALDWALRQLRDPEVFLGKVKELYAHPEDESHDSIEFKDGRIFERYSRPQRIDGRIVGRVWSFRDVTAPKQAEESLQLLTGRLLQLQDEERRRIARELHDTTAQNLTALSMNLSLLGQSCSAWTDESRQLLADCLTNTDQCCEEIRTLSYLLHPPQLDEMGLIGAAKEFADGFARRSGFRLNLELPPAGTRLPRDVEMALFRVLQESLGNVHRHSGSKTATVRLMRGPDEVRLEVLDAGCGIPDGRQTSGLGVGIAGMQERMKQVGGKLEIDSGPNGTTIRAIVPGRMKKP